MVVNATRRQTVVQYRLVRRSGIRIEGFGDCRGREIGEVRQAYRRNRLEVGMIRMISTERAFQKGLIHLEGSHFRHA
jgi:hypothetical protein